MAYPEESMKKHLLISLLAGCLTAAPVHDARSLDRADPLITDHDCTWLLQIPASWIDSVQANRRMHYAHTSHGMQLSIGLEIIEDDDPAYSYVYRNGVLPTEAGAFCIFNGQEGDTYVEPDEYWRTRDGMDKTRDVLDHNPTINTSMWAWCQQLDGYTEAQVQQYLDSIGVLESQYPDVVFIYMTGNAQAGGAGGYNRYQRNDQIRAFCVTNNKVLYDFADLDCWWYNTGTEQWEHSTYTYGEVEVPIEHSEFHGSNAGHTNDASCVQKANALWWMMAVISGWPGTQSVEETTLGDVKKMFR